MRNVWFPLLIVLCTVAAGVYFVLRPALHHETTPLVMRVGVLPDEGVESLRKWYAPLLDYLSAKTGLEFQLVLPSGYGELLRMFGNREVELAYFGGLTFVQAFDTYAAAPLVMRDVDTRFTVGLWPRVVKRRKVFLISGARDSLLVAGCRPQGI